MTARRRLVIGVGARSGVPQAELDLAVDQALAAVSRNRDDVAVVATLARKIDEFRSWAEVNDWELVGFEAAELEATEVAQPSAVVHTRTGTPSVAEAAAKQAGGVLIASKRVFPRVTVAIAERVPA